MAGHLHAHRFHTIRGSRKRLRRIRLRGNWSIEFWVIVAIIVFMLLVGLPWLIRHPIVDDHHVGQTLYE
jgi:hypothetical protein